MSAPKTSSSVRAAVARVLKQRPRLLLPKLLSSDRRETKHPVGGRFGSRGVRDERDRLALVDGIALGVAAEGELRLVDSPVGFAIPSVVSQTSVPVSRLGGTSTTLFVSIPAGATMSWDTESLLARQIMDVSGTRTVTGPVDVI